MPGARSQLLGQYQIGKTIGQGAFSKVKIGVHKATNQKVALKVIDKAQAKRLQEQHDRKQYKEAQAVLAKSGAHAAPWAAAAVAQLGPDAPKETGLMSSFQLEVQLLMRLDHPNIISIFQVVDTPQECWVVMEYAPGGELIDYILAHDHLGEKEARRLFRQIISAMDHCHLANVVHRDLKLENLLLNKQKDLLISDFGLGRTFSSDKDDLMRTFCGTPNYAAIELISGIPYIGVKSDIWAMGIILYVMLTGRPPFTGETISALYAKIKALDYVLPRRFSPELCALFSKIFVKDPKERATMDMLRSDPWVNRDETELPPRIMPALPKNNEVQKLGTFIKNIVHEKDCITYTFKDHVSTSVHLEKVALPKSPDRLANSPRSPVNGIDMGGRRLSSIGVRRGSEMSQRSNNGYPGSLANNTSTSNDGIDGDEAIAKAPSYGDGDMGIPEEEEQDEASHSGRPAGAVSTGTGTETGTTSGSIVAPTTASSSSSPTRRAALNQTTLSSRSRHKSAGLTLNAALGGGGSGPPSAQSTGASLPNGHRRISSAGPGMPIDHPLNVARRMSAVTGPLRPASAAPPVIEARPSRRASHNVVVTGLRAVGLNSSRSEARQTPLLAQSGHDLKPSGGHVAGIMHGGFPDGGRLRPATSIEDDPDPLHKMERLSTPVGNGDDGTDHGGCSRDADGDSDEEGNRSGCSVDIEPTTQEIEQWHAIHRPPTVIRSVRFSVNTALTSSLAPTVLWQEVHQTLLMLQRQYDGKFSFKRIPEYYMMDCTLLRPDGKKMELEIELCKIWLLKIHGLRIKRLSGDPFLFKEIYQNLLSTFEPNNVEEEEL